MPSPPAVEVVHASIAPVDTLLAERRALYSLAAELLCPGADTAELPDDLLDSPPVRFRLGEALGGRGTWSLRDLVECRNELGPTRNADGLAVVAHPGASGPLDPVLRLIETQPGLRLLTADDPRYEAAFAVVEEGVRLARELSPDLVADVLAHVDLFAVLDPDTSHGLVSASSRWFPGLVLIDKPATPLEVAEALVHEGAHQKFFDLAMTRSFLGFEADDAEQFETSWSRKRWPMEQTVAAWHAYTSMHRFALDAGVVDGRLGVHTGSLLPEAGKRSAEIGEWLVRHAEFLQVDALTLLKGLLPGAAIASREKMCAEPPVIGCTRMNPLVRFGKREQPGRRIVAMADEPPQLFWDDPDAGRVLQLIGSRADGLGVDEIVAHQAALWGVAAGVAHDRVSTALRALLEWHLVSSM